LRYQQKKARGAGLERINQNFKRPGKKGKTSRRANGNSHEMSRFKISKTVNAKSSDDKSLELIKIP